MLVIAAGAGVAYFAIPQPDLPEAAAALASTGEVQFERVGDRLEYRPTGADPTVGLILYPGGKVDAAAYAPAARAIAAASGALVAVVPMPLNLAVLDIEAATRVIEEHPEIDHWAIGGHSLGGAMAAEYAARHPGSVAGLVLWAAYSATDLSGQQLRVLLVFGTLDGGASRFVSDESLGRLPPDRTILAIAGGNHEQMGWYTGQPNDPPATIARADQQRELAASTAQFLIDLAD